MYNSANPIVNSDGTPTRSFYAFCRQIWNSLGGGEEIDIADKVEENCEAIAANDNEIKVIKQTMCGYGDIVTHNAAEFVKYLSNKPAKITSPVGGTTIDTEARTAIDSIISVLEQYKLTKEI